MYGQLHLYDGPAIIDPHGSEEYFIEGRRHRLDGPVWIMLRAQFWYVDGRNITKFSAHQKLSYIRAYQRAMATDASPCVAEILTIEMRP